LLNHFGIVLCTFSTLVVVSPKPRRAWIAPLEAMGVGCSGNAVVNGDERTRSTNHNRTYMHVAPSILFTFREQRQYALPFSKTESFTPSIRVTSAVLVNGLDVNFTKKCINL